MSKIEKKQYFYAFIAISCLCVPAYLGLYVFPTKLFFVRLILNFSFVLLPALIFNFRLRNYFLFISPFILTVPMELVHLWQYQSPLSLGGVAATFETNFHEAGEFFKARLGVFVFAAINIFLYLWVVLKKIKKDFRLSRRFRNILICSFFALFVLQTSLFLWKQRSQGLNSKKVYRFIKNRIVSYYPVNSNAAVAEYVFEKIKMSRMKKNRLNSSFEAKRESLGEKETYIVIIGESARRHNWSLYGYKRPTNPRLQRTSNLLVFRDVISSATQTTTSLTAAFTQAEPDDYSGFYEKPSIITAAKEAGLHTYWISNQGKYGLIEADTTLLAEESHETFFKQDSYLYTFHDGSLLEKLKLVLERKEPRKLIFLHTVGSHAEYKYRSPNEFKKFKGGKTSEIDEYDNSILYTDFFISSVIQSMQGEENAWVLYFSDHGENLYDDDRKYWGHGLPSPSRYEVEVPLLIWTSRGLREKNQEKLLILEKRQNSPITLSSLFESLSGLLGLSFIEFNEEKDFTSKKYKVPQERKVLDVNGNVIQYKDMK